MDGRFGKLERLQELLILFAKLNTTDDAEYALLRRELIADPEIAQLLPEFIRNCRDVAQLSEFMRRKWGLWSQPQRHSYLWEEFRPALDYLETGARSPVDREVSEALKRFNSDRVQAVWTRALARCAQDPEGAITAARTLLETVFKHILDDDDVEYDDSADLPKLYAATAKHLDIAPTQHTEAVFKQILGGCTAVVEGLGALRNRLGDSHGKGPGRVRPAPRHAQLAVNLAGAMAAYLVTTRAERPRDAAA